MYAFDSRVRYSECDGSGRLSLVSLIDYFQDCSTFQSQELGHGLASLSPRGLAWALTSWHIEVDELPAFGTPVTVSTWCYEMTRAHACRNFRLATAEGRTLARADSRWAVFDTARDRAVRVPADQLVYCTGEEPLDLGAPERRLRPEGTGTPCPELVVRAQSIDTNGHVNNAQYVLFAELALEALGLRVPTGRVDVSYRAMARLGDAIAPVVYPDGPGWVVDLAAPDGASFALVRLRDR